MTTQSCALCGRKLGVNSEAHHLTPRTYGGREIVPLHPICHRKIHTILSERDLRDRFNTLDALRAHPDIALFLRWIANKPPDFHVRTKTSRKRRK
jgi:5-methylcytosine-specific restriction endonuclease McrA